MKVLFVGVFDTTKQSTNTSQILAFKKIGLNVSGYNYRSRASVLGERGRDKELINLIMDRSFDLVVYSKCNRVSLRVFQESRKYSKTCLWFMDPLITYDEEMQQKTSLVDYFCCDKQNVLQEAKKYNNNSFHVCEGFDEDIDKPHIDIEKVYEVSFIGNLYGDRVEKIASIKRPIEIITGAFGREHSKKVSESMINLNFCTSNGASDRVYKILAAGGFLLTEDWHGREELFKDGKDLVIFKNMQDLKQKIDFFIKRPEDRKRVANSGLETVQNYTRLNWAKRIIELYEQL